MFPSLLIPGRLASLAAGLVLLPCVFTLACSSFKSTGKAAPNMTALPDLPKASSVFADKSRVVAYHGSRFQITETLLDEAPAIVRFSVERDGKKRGHEGLLGEWVAAGDFAVKFEERADPAAAGTQAIQATFYHLPSLPSPTAEEGVVVDSLFQADSFKKLKGGWISLTKLAANDAKAADDDGAVVQMALGGEVESLTLREFTSQRMKDFTVAVGDVVPDAPDSATGTAEISVRNDGRGWGDEVERQVATSTDASISFEGFSLSTAVFQRDKPFVLLSVSGPGTSRDVVLAEGQGVRLGRAGFEVEKISEEAVELAMIKYSADRRPSSPSDAGADPDTDGEEERSASTRLVAGSPYSFSGARWELVRVSENDRTNVMDDTAQVLVRYAAGGSGTYTIREGSRDTVRGGNRWWILSVTNAEGGRYPYADVDIEAGEFLGEE